MIEKELSFSNNSLKVGSSHHKWLWNIFRETDLSLFLLKLWNFQISGEQLNRDKKKAFNNISCFHKHMWRVTINSVFNFCLDFLLTFSHILPIWVLNFNLRSILMAPLFHVFYLLCCIYVHICSLHHYYLLLNYTCHVCFHLIVCKPKK